MISLGLSLGLSSGFGFGGVTTRLSPQLQSLSAEIISAHEADADTYFSGWTDDTGFTVVTAADADAVRSAIESWRLANFTTLLKIECDWDGLSDLSNTVIRGPSSASLTPNAAVLGGYDLPSGGVWITPASGRTPAFGNEARFLGFNRLFLENIGFAKQQNGAGSSSLYSVEVGSSSSFPLAGLIAFKDCKIGLGHWRPLEPASEYALGIKANGPVYVLHVENNDFFGVGVQIQAQGQYSRIWRNYSRKALGDFCDAFGFLDTKWTGRTVWQWVEGNVLADIVNDASFSGRHIDFLQYTSANEVHDGSNILVRYNISHAESSLMSDSGSQFIFGRHYGPADNASFADSTQAYNIAAHDNVGAYSAYWGVSFWSVAGGSCYVERNTFMRSGSTYLDADTYPAISTDEDTGDCEVFVRGNYLTAITDSAAEVDSTTGNFYVDPRANVVSGDGSTEAEAQRPEDVFNGTFSRDGSDFLTYNLSASAGVDRATAKTAMRNFFTPSSGWGVDAGSTDPSNW